MKYELDTMPVWDAVRDPLSAKVCPFCQLEKKVTLNYLRFYLSDAVMVPETRVQMNETGFSRDHWRLLLQDQRRLPLALAAETRFKRFREQLSPELKKLKTEARLLSEKSGLGALTAGKDGLKKSVASFADSLSRHQASCLISQRVKETMNRYLYTAAHLHKTDKDFPEPFTKITLCANHLTAVAEMAAETLDGVAAGKLIAAALDAAERGWQQTQADVYQFTQLFEHASGGDFSGVTDAPERVVSLMHGWVKNRDKNEERRR